VGSFEGVNAGDSGLPDPAHRNRRFRSRPKGGESVLSDGTSNGPISEADVVRLLSTAYGDVKRRKRELRLSDKLVEDLDLDSLDAIDILTLVEEDIGFRIVESVAERLDQFVTVGDVVRAIKEIGAISSPSTPG
jgi:acyl carrier protein